SGDCRHRLSGSRRHSNCDTLEGITGIISAAKPNHWRRPAPVSPTSWTGIISPVPARRYKWVGSDGLPCLTSQPAFNDDDTTHHDCGRPGSRLRNHTRVHNGIVALDTGILSLSQLSCLSSRARW